MRISDWSSDVCSSDLFGGGSGLDCAKAIALMVGQKRPMWDFEDVGDNWKLVDPAGVAPIIAVPTTAGTGSEVGRASVITTEAKHTKKIIFHPKMMTSIDISDPDMTVGLPPHIPDRKSTRMNYSH